MNFNLTFDEKSLNVILHALSKQPYEAVADIILQIQMQVHKAQEEATKAKEEPKKK